eukprot:s269_g5.t1
MASPIVSLPAAPAVCNAAVRSSKTPFRGPWAPRRTAAKGSAMLFLLAARARRRHRVTPRRSTTSASGRPTALLMDGDGQGAREFRAAWTAVSQHQKLVYTGVFAAEEQLKRSDWQKFFRETGAEAVPVPPHGGASFAQKQRFAETVGHTAMAQTAVRFFQEGLQVALLPSEREGRPWNGRDVNMDVDFVALVKFLRSKGAEELLMVLLEGPAFRCPESVALSKDFVRYGAEVFWVEVKWFGFRTPLMRAVLQHGSAGRVEHIPKDEERGPLADITHLLDLGFMTSSRDAIAPAIARCWAQNFPGSPLTVWPAQYPLHQLRDALAGCASWTFDSLEMAFVMPVGSKGRATKEVIAKYGTADCRSIFLGGGPFLLEDSEELCEEVLRRLGYLDDELNSHLEEAVALFCDGTANRRTLQVAGEAPTSAGGTASLQSLRRALLSRKIYGAWRCAPNDNLLRINFSGKKLITSQEASKEEVYAAMQSYVTRAAIPSWRSYNGLVSCIQDDVNRNGWIWARGEKRGQVLRLPWVERFGDEENMESLLGSWQMLKEGGLVQVKDFLPTDLAQDMLEMLKALPQEEWHLSENQSSVDAEHRFWRYEGQSCQPSPQPSALGRNAWVQLRP